MTFVFDHVRRFFGNPAGYKLRWPRPRTVGSGHGRSRRRRPCGTFARMLARARSTIRRGYASVSFHARGAPSRCCLHARAASSRCYLLARGTPSRCCLLRGVPPRAPRLKAPSTRARVKSCAMIAALDEISGLAPRAVHVRVSASPLLRGCREALGSWPEQHLRDSFLSLDDGEIGEVASIRNAIRAIPARGSPPRRDA